MPKEKNRSITGNLDEGANVTTRLPYSDSISTKASSDIIEKAKKNKKLK